MATRDPLLKRQKEPKAKQRRRAHSVLQDQDTIEAVCLAELGKSNLVIRQRDINLKDGQLTYRLKKAKEAAGYKKGDGFRRAWREGRSNYEEVVRAILPQLRKEYEKNILPQVTTPLVKGASEKDANG